MAAAAVGAWWWAARAPANSAPGGRASTRAAITGSAALVAANSSPRHQIYERTRRELEGEKSPEVWDDKNAALRRLGLSTIPNPNE